MKCFPFPSLAIATLIVLISSCPVRAADSSVSYKDIREAAVTVVGDFVQSETIILGDVPAIRVKTVVNHSRLRPDSDRVEGMFRKALSEYDTVTVANDASAAEFVLTPALRIEADGNYVLSAAVSDASTGRRVWTGSSRFGKPQAAIAETVPAPAVAGVAPVVPTPSVAGTAFDVSALSVTDSVLGVSLPSVSDSALGVPTPSGSSSVLGVSPPPLSGSVLGAPAPATVVPVPAAVASVVDLPVPDAAPTFVDGAAKTWDEWFERGIESVGYHAAGSAEEDEAPEPERKRRPPQERGFMGRSSIQIGGTVDFQSIHDFHHCRAGRGGNGFASGTVDFRLNLLPVLRNADFVAHFWYKDYLDDPYAGLDNPREEFSRASRFDMDSHGADFRL